ncbi:archaemetzincin-2-like [Antedon mediterranea]|uniref:archaemetzincin-2-like n=1 Tax=Antedon mediterranea TaxID=105859 RepID=UPI003AF7C1DA
MTGNTISDNLTFDLDKLYLVSKSSDKKNARYLVGKLKNIDPSLQAYFMLSACCFLKQDVTVKKQILVSDLYSSLHSSFNIPRSNYILALTWTDLYPTEELNFVLEEASYSCRCAVFGFGRYEPKSYVSTPDGDNANKAITDENKLALDGQLLWKLIRVASHETCHLLGLNHCLFFECSMNESKSVKKALHQPLFLCPVCLRKLHKSLGFDIRQRYAQLRDFLQNTNNHYQNDSLQAVYYG